MSLSRSVIWVLAKDNDFDVIQRRGIEGVKYLFRGRKDDLTLLLLLQQERLQLLHVGFIKRRGQMCQPARIEINLTCSARHKMQTWPVQTGPQPSKIKDRKSTRLNSSHVKNSYAVS